MRPNEYIPIHTEYIERFAHLKKMEQRLWDKEAKD